MKIAEALVRIKDIKGKLASLLANISIEQNYEQIDVNEPVPNKDQEIEDFCFLTQDLADLKAKINKTNTEHGLTEKIYRMEALRSIIKQLEGMTHAKQRTVRLHRVDYTGPATQIYVYATYDVCKVLNRVENARLEIRALDLELQRLNWEIDLEE